MSTTLKIWDERMFQLMDLLIYNKTVSTEKEFLESIGFANTNNIKQVREGKQSFRHQHLLAASEQYNINMNWLYGRTSSKSFKEKAQSPIDLISDALLILKKNEISVNKAVNKTKKEGK